MKTIRWLVILIVLCLAGCTLPQSYSYKAVPVEVLSQDEIRNVLSKFKVYLSGRGMIQIIQPENKNHDYATFDIGSGADFKGTIKEYLELSYTPGNGFILKLTKITGHPLYFFSQYMNDIKLKTEQIISEETSKNVQFRIVD